MRALRFRFVLKTVLFAQLFVASAACSHSRPATAPSQSLFLTIPEKRTIAVFPVDVSESPKPLARIVEDAPDEPLDASTDVAREIFVANVNGNVKAFGGQNNHYSRIHLLEGPNTKLAHPQGIAVDMAGSFYVTDAGEAPGHERIEWFAGGMNGNVTPNRLIQGPHTLLSNPVGIGLDGSGRIYVADEGANKVLVFAAEADGDAAPIAVIDGLHDPQRLFVDSFLNIFVSNKGDNTISVFENDGPTTWDADGTLSGDALKNPRGVVTDSAGRIIVGVPGNLVFFPPNSKGIVQPIAVLSLGAGLDPMGISIR
jgi:DNA-binding beta-propeller fold protein YncE